MNRLSLKKLFPSIPAGLLIAVFTIDLLSLINKSVIERFISIREILLVIAFILLIPTINKSKWIVDKNIANKIKLLIFSVAGIYLSFFVPKLLLQPNLNLIKKNINPIFLSINNLLYATLSSIAITIFSVFILLLLRDLIYAKRKRSTHRNFRFLLYIMIIQILYFNYQNKTGQFLTDLSEGGMISRLFLILLILFIVINSFRTSWVNYLNKQQKLACFGWGLMLLPAAFMIAAFSYHQIIFHYSATLGIFLRQVTLFLSIYWSLAMLSILVHLPTAGLYDRKRKEIDSLHRLSKAITSEFDPDKLLFIITKQSSEVIEANAVWLEVLDSEKRQLLLASTDNLTQSEQDKIRTHRDKSLSDWILKHKTGILINEIGKDDRTKYLLKVNRHIGSLLSVPLISYDKILGILYAVKLEEYGFEVDDRNMLQSFADQAAVALENARLIKESIIKERLEEELKVAHDAQMKLLPKTMPRIKGLDIDAICVTANEVGGDYYDFFKINRNKLAIVIGDVSGKGPEAAFYMAEVKGIVESLSKTYSSPKDLLIKTNVILYENWDRKTFVTLLYGIIDVNEMKLTFSRGGHCPLLYHSIKNGSAQFIEPDGIGLGLERGKIFKQNIEEIDLELHSKDMLLFYTDGIIEAMNTIQEEFGEGHFLTAASQFAHLNSSEIKIKIIQEVQTFVGDATPHDDLTMVVVKVV